jgi:hypothetical protein
MRASWMLLAPLVTVTPLAVQGQTPDEVAVRRTVQFYLDGLKANDIPTTRKAFHPSARLYWVQHDTLASYDQAEWFKADYPTTTPVPSPDANVPMRIALVDIAGDAAIARVEEDYPSALYIDYLSLLRIHGEWRVVNKIYTSRSKRSR